MLITLVLLSLAFQKGQVLFVHWSRPFLNWTSSVAFRFLAPSGLFLGQSSLSPLYSPFTSTLLCGIFAWKGSVFYALSHYERNYKAIEVYLQKQKLHICRDKKQVPEHWLHGACQSVSHQLLALHKAKRIANTVSGWEFFGAGCCRLLGNTALNQTLGRSPPGMATVGYPKCNSGNRPYPQPYHNTIDTSATSDRSKDTAMST